MKRKNLSTTDKLKKTVKENIVLISFFAVIVVIAAAILVLNGNDSDSENLPYGDDVVTMYYFHLSTCPHCHEQNKFNEKLKAKYPNLKIEEYEITEPGSKEKYLELSQQVDGMDPQRVATPTTVIGDRVNVGFGTEATTGPILEDMIDERIEEIMADWDDDTMVTTIELRKQLYASQ